MTKKKEVLRRVTKKLSTLMGGAMVVSAAHASTKPVAPPSKREGHVITRTDDRSSPPKLVLKQQRSGMNVIAHASHSSHSSHSSRAS